MLKKGVFALILGAALLLFSGSNVFASEGDIFLRNIQGGPSRCAARSVLMPDFNYNVLITCRDLIYPVNPEILHYVVWAQPLSGNPAIKLGDLSFGKVLFKTKEGFSSVFVTQERASDNRNLKEPGTVVMRGNITAINGLEDGSTPPATIEESPSVSASPTPAPTGNIFSRFRTGAVITVVSVFIIILMLILVKPFK